MVGVEPFPVLPRAHYSDVTNNFTISVWVKPEIDLGLPSAGGARAWSSFFIPRSYVIYPPAGEDLYGLGHAACGLEVGRDGIMVEERSQGNPSPVLVSRIPLSGWTHLALVYRAGAPSLFVNGKLVGKGQKSAKIIHPGIGEAFQRDGASYFHGDMSKPKLTKEMLSESRIDQLVWSGVPAPEEPPDLELLSSGKSELLIWRNGRYVLHGHGDVGTTLDISVIERPQQILGPWQVSFPPDLGAPSEITLRELISLHKHTNEGVRFFRYSGVHELL